MLLFIRVVGTVNPNMPFYDEYKQRIQTLFEAGVEVAACVSIARAFGLEKEQKNRNQIRRTSVHDEEHVSQVYTIMTF